MKHVLVKNSAAAIALHALVHIEVQHADRREFMVFAWLIKNVQLLAANLQQPNQSSFAAEINKTKVALNPHTHTLFFLYTNLTFYAEFLTVF
jgi:hypothetical protein